MEIQLILKQQAELGAPTQDSLPMKKSKHVKDKRIGPKSDMRAIQGRLARKLMRTVRMKVEGDHYREVQE